MNKDIKKKWVDALRSGEYKQGKGQLRLYDVSFCCLGVLCNLAMKEGLAKWENNSFLDQEFGLPEEVTNWAGLKEGDFQICDNLAGMNDKGIGFEEIADVAESKL